MSLQGFWLGFEKRAKAVAEQAPSERSDASKALGVGAATTGGLAAAQGTRSAIRDHRAYKAAPHVNSINHLKRHAKPGDIFFTRKEKSPGWGNSKTLTEKNVIQSAMGSPEYHAALYTKNKQVFHAHAGGAPASHHFFQKGQAFLPGESVHVYRPTAATKAERESALKQPQRLRNRRYKESPQMMGDAAKALVSKNLTGKACHNVQGRIVCNEVVTSAYPKQFKRRGATIEDMKSTKGMKLVATYGKKPSMIEHATARGVYPLMRNAKWGLGAGVASYAALKARKAFMKKKQEENT